MIQLRRDGGLNLENILDGLCNFFAEKGTDEVADGQPLIEAEIMRNGVKP